VHDWFTNLSSTIAVIFFDDTATFQIINETPMDLESVEYSNNIIIAVGLSNSKGIIRTST
jgi:hypothetical protein